MPASQAISRGPSRRQSGCRDRSPRSSPAPGGGRPLIHVSKPAAGLGHEQSREVTVCLVVGDEYVGIQAQVLVWNVATIRTLIEDHRTRIFTTCLRGPSIRPLRAVPNSERAVAQVDLCGLRLCQLRIGEPGRRFRIWPRDPPAHGRHQDHGHAEKEHEVSPMLSQPRAPRHRPIILENLPVIS